MTLAWRLLTNTLTLQGALPIEVRYISMYESGKVPLRGYMGWPQRCELQTTNLTPSACDRQVRRMNSFAKDGAKLETTSSFAA